MTERSTTNDTDRQTDRLRERVLRLECVDDVRDPSEVDNVTATVHPNNK